jgi:FkbM family methyltransferase
MQLGVFQHGWWKPAGGRLGHTVIDLPIATHADGNAYAADVAARREVGAAGLGILEDHRAEVLLDNGGTGLGFLTGSQGPDNLDLLHERVRIPLCSHFVDPIVTAFQGLPWPVVWQCLKSTLWVKAVWDRTQAVELQRFGVPNVVHLPMAAPEHAYRTEPIEPQNAHPLVSFVGGQNTSYFLNGASVPTAGLLPGALAHALQTDLKQASFYDAYHDLHGFGAPVSSTDDLNSQVVKTAAYFNAKLFYNAVLSLRQRDRFVIFLKRKLGDLFRLIGPRWDRAYGLACEPPLSGVQAYLNHFRETAINLNLVNGNAESGLNMRHFEITAAGGFMLCYDQPELAQSFVPGKECAVFHSEEDLLEKIHHYLARPEERAAIAMAGQNRTLSEHLFHHRLEKLLAMLRPDGRTLPVEYSKGSLREDLPAVVSEPQVILDCGANIGQMAAAFRGLYPKAVIYSFEPVSSVFDQLKKRCAELGVYAVQKAVSDRDGRSTMHLTAGREAHSLLHFQEGNPCEQWTRVVGREEVEVCTLDRWCQENGIHPARVSILKLDLQGAELKALYGARRLLQTVQAVYVEVSFVALYKDAPLFPDIDAFLKECGYRRQAVYPSDQPHHWGDALYIKEST